MGKPVRKAVLPVAGLRTRVLPVGKTTPKNLLNVVDRPILSYIVAEARAAGIEHIVFIVSRGQGAIEDYFDSIPEIETALSAKGKVDILEDVRRPIPAESRFDHHLRFRPGRRHRLGQGHGAVVDPHLAQHLAGDVLPDDHRPAPVQVDTDVLSFHRGLLLASRGFRFRRPECVHARSFSTRGGP